MGGYSEKNQGAVIDGGEMDAGQAETTDVRARLLVSQPQPSSPI